ncbi:hypothetical protein BDQ17DRAFT_1327534 [Cyathus striatus]|nr:hypothetical protein BDQ17DRAFT_1327534 [Cyathus striatus]
MSILTQQCHATSLQCQTMPGNITECEVYAIIVRGEALHGVEVEGRTTMWGFSGREEPQLCSGVKVAGGRRWVMTEGNIEVGDGLMQKSYWRWQKGMQMYHECFMMYFSSSFYRLMGFNEAWERDECVQWEEVQMTEGSMTSISGLLCLHFLQSLRVETT